jgi:hypothetical protein
VEVVRVEVVLHDDLAVAVTGEGECMPCLIAKSRKTGGKQARGRACIYRRRLSSQAASHAKSVSIQWYLSWKANTKRVRG